MNSRNAFALAQVGVRRPLLRLPFEILSLIDRLITIPAVTTIQRFYRRFRRRAGRLIMGIYTPSQQALDIDPTAQPVLLAGPQWLIDVSQ